CKTGVNRLLKQYNWWPLTCLLGGVLYAFGFPSMLSYHCVIPIGPMLGGFLLFRNFNWAPLKDKFDLKRHLLYVMLFSLGYYLVGYYWIPETLRAFGNVAAPFNYLMGFIFPLFILPQYLLVPVLLKTISR